MYEEIYIVFMILFMFIKKDIHCVRVSRKIRFQMYSNSTLTLMSIIKMKMDHSRSHHHWKELFHISSVGSSLTYPLFLTLVAVTTIILNTHIHQILKEA